VKEGPKDRVIFKDNFNTYDYDFALIASQKRKLKKQSKSENSNSQPPPTNDSSNNYIATIYFTIYVQFFIYNLNVKFWNIKNGFVGVLTL
jgi:hypothetical protein